MSVVKGVEVLLPLIARPPSWITSMLLDPTPAPRPDPPHTEGEGSLWRPTKLKDGQPSLARALVVPKN